MNIKNDVLKTKLVLYFFFFPSLLIYSEEENSSEIKFAVI